MVIEATNNPFEALLEGKLDLALICEPIRNRKIHYTPLFEDDVVIVVPPKHRLAAKNCAAPEDFATENILLYPPKSDSTLLTKILGPAGIQPRKIQEVMLTEVILEMVIGGLGIAAGLSLAMVHRSVARQSPGRLRSGIYSRACRKPHARGFLSACAQVQTAALDR